MDVQKVSPRSAAVELAALLDSPEIATLVADLRAKLHAKNAWRDCPACGTSAWSIGSELILAQSLGDDWRLHAIGRGWPMVAVFCVNCGFTRLHNAQILGVEQAKPDTEGIGSPEPGKKT